MASDATIKLQKLRAAKRDAVIVANDFHYPESVIKRIDNAVSVEEINRIMIKATDLIPEVREVKPVKSAVMNAENCGYKCFCTKNYPTNDGGMWCYGCDKYVR